MQGAWGGEGRGGGHSLYVHALLRGLERMQGRSGRSGVCVLFTAGQDRCQVVGHRQRHLQKDPHGKPQCPGLGSASLFTSLPLPFPHLFCPQGSTIRKRKMYESFLEKVSILGKLTDLGLANGMHPCQCILILSSLFVSVHLCRVP